MRLFFKLTAIWMAVITSFCSFAQTGPGGIGNESGSGTQPKLTFWMDASQLSLANGADVLTWVDKSGNGQTFSAVTATSPLFTSSGPNGNPYLTFSKSDNRIVLTPFDDMPDRELSVMIVYQTTDSGDGLLSYAVSGNDNEFLIFDNNAIRTYIDQSNNNSGESYNSGNWQIYGLKWQSSDGSLELFRNNTLVHSATHQTGRSMSNGGSFAIGNEQDGVNSGYSAGQAFSGGIAEIILMDHYLTQPERQILSNYLSSKYGITISGDLYAGDTPGNGNYDLDVIGIGQAGGDQHTSSSAAGLTLTTEGSSLDQNNEFILAGHASTSNSISTSDLPAGVEERWSRDWYIDKTGTVGATIGFDFTIGIGGQYPADNGDYVLLRWNGSSYDNMGISGTVSGTQVRFAVDNTSLTDGRYTVGTTDATASPLTGVANQIWYSYQTGDWTDPLTWTLDGSVTPTYNNPGGNTPSSIDDVVITNGRTVTMDIDALEAADLEVIGTLDVGSTENHTFQNISGIGRIRLSGNTANQDNFPAGNSVDFGSDTGGTVEWYGGSISLNQARTFNNMEINLSASSNDAVLFADYSLNGELVITRGHLQFNDNSSTTDLNVEVQGDVIVQSNGRISTGSGNARHEFTLYGDLLNNGGQMYFSNRSAPNYTAEATNGIVDVNFRNDAGNQEIVCSGISEFYRIEIDKGEDQTYVLDISASDPANFAIYGPTNDGHGSTAQLSANDNALGLLRGTVKISTNVVIPRLNNGGNYNVSEAARIWVDGGAVTKPSGTAIVIYGTLELSNGTIDAPISSGLTTRNNGNIVVSGGVMNTRQIRTSVLGVENVGGYTQSGGDVFINGGSYNADYYAFSLTFPGNTFTMTGGTLQVRGVSGGGPSGRQGGVFINVKEGNYNVTGGTVILENTTGQNFKVTSSSPFWNVIMRESGGSSTEVELDAGSSGDNNPGEFQTISTPTLRVINDLTIESGVLFDHNGFNVEIGGNFTIENGGDYEYNNGKRNTTTINGTSNSVLTFNNRTGGVGDEQRFWNLIINKPADKTVSLASGKADLTNNENNLLRIDGDAFKVLSGTLDNGFHSVRVYTDSLVNYQRIGVYDPANASPDDTANGDNDLIKFRPDAFVLLTADTSVFGNVRLNSADEIVTLVSDVKMERLDYRHGRIDLNVNKLTIDQLSVRLSSSQTRTDEDSGGNFSVEDMLITSGNASDGGLSLYVPSNGENPGFINMTGAGNTNSNPTIFFFPLGTGTTGNDTDSEYTPANIRLLSATDDGYITVKPVQGKLPTAGPYPLGNDMSDRYWIIDYEGFTTVPVVERIWFRSVEKDDPNGGATGFPSNFVPGYVLDDAPYTRTPEISGAAPSTSGFVTNGTTNIQIFFWGNTGSGNPAGFNLINAAYTAGDPSKFVGAPTVFYNRNNGRRNWNDASKWTENSDGSDDGVNTIPGTGDVVVIRNYGEGNQNAWVNLNIDIEIARLNFDDSYGGWRPRLWITRRNALANLGIVSGTGAVYVEHTVAQQPDFTGTDFGIFADEENSFFVFRADANDTNPIPLPTTFSVYPNLRIEGGNGAFNQRITQNTIPITVNKDMWIDWGGTFSAARDINIKGRLQVGRGGGARGLFEIYDDQAVTVDVDGDLELLDNTGDPRFLVRNTNTNSLEHTVRVGGDLLIERGQFDLFNGNGTDNNARLIFDGTGDATFTRTGGSLPDLYRIGVSKANNRNDVVDLQSDFDLSGPTDTADKPVFFVSGILKFNNSGLDITLSDDGDVTIPGTAGLQVTQGTTRVLGDDTGIILDGCIVIDGGILDMTGAGNGNNFIEYSSSGNALIDVSAGELLIGSQLRPIVSAETGVLSYQQTGGDVSIGVNAAPESSRGMLQIYNPGSEFTYTGGTLTISRHQNSPSVAALYLDPEQSNVTGTITIFDSNTPSGQNDFRINSTVALGSLIIQGNNNPSAIISINPLTISGDLAVNSGATLDGNGLTLTLEGDFTNNGIYLPSSNETIFDGSSDQVFSGSGTGNFYDLTKLNSSTLDISKDASVNGLFSLLDGVIDDNGNSILLLGNALMDGTHLSSGSGNGITFGGSSTQQLYRSEAGTGTFGTVTIDNGAGVVIPDGNGYNFTIQSDLRMANGVLNIGSSLLTIGQLSEIVAVAPFSVTNMIQTNSSFTDNGVLKNFTAGYNQDFVFPVGELLYTPVSFNFGSGANTFGSSNGSIKVRPSAEYHPTVNDGVDFFATGDINNVLQYYWIIETATVSGLTAEMTMNYNQSDVKSDEPGYDETDYLAARILSFSNPTNAINKFTTSEVDETANSITFQLTGVSNDGISGDYFAGIDEAIPSTVLTYTSQVNGDVDQPIYDLAVPGGGPPNGAVLRVANGTTVSFNVDGVSLYRTEIEAGGILEIDETSQHRLGIVSGSGILRIVSNGSNAFLPAGFYGDFLSCSGGGLEYSGSGSYTVMSGITAVRSLLFTGSGNRSVANNNIQICEDLIVDGPSVQGRSQRRITVNDDFIIDNGVFNAPTGTNGRVIISDNLEVNGGQYNGAISSGQTDVRGNVGINGGNLSVGGQSYELKISGNLSRTSGTFNGGSNQSKVIFQGNGAQNVSGGFTGSNSMNKVEINKSGQLRLQGDVTVTDVLYLENGFIVPNANQFLMTSTATATPVIGSSNSYVLGKLYKEIATGEDFIFPIGKGSFWRYASVQNVTTGTRTWEAEYFPTSPETNAMVDNLTSLDPAIVNISVSEHWVISDGSVASTGTNAKIGLSWGVDSDVSSTKSDREKLVVMNWNDALSGWDNLGGENFSPGHSQNQGDFESIVTASFSEQVFTLGTSDLSNPLPITLEYFRGRVTGSTNFLEWKTVSELNNAYFELQHSTNGESFETIVKVEGNGTTSSSEFYSFLDTTPAAGVNYYRLKQVDFDGTATYAPDLVRLENEFEGLKDTMVLYPNPTQQENINLRFETNRPNQKVMIRLLDLYGRVVMQDNWDIVSGNNEIQLVPKTNLRPGMYIITLQVGFETITQRILIK